MKAMMTTEYVCQLLENSFRKGQNTNNEDAVFGILSWVQNRLGDEGLIRLFEKMASYGESLPWVVDVSGKTDSEIEQIRSPTGNPKEARYYKKLKGVGTKRYLLSSQWYSYVRYPEKEQTLRTLLDEVVEILLEDMKLYMMPKH